MAWNGTLEQEFSFLRCDADEKGFGLSGVEEDIDVDTESEDSLCKSQLKLYNVGWFSGEVIWFILSTLFQTSYSELHCLYFCLHCVRKCKKLVQNIISLKLNALEILGC